MNLASTINETSVSLRPRCASDEAFLFQVYASTRVEELSAVAWDDQQKQTFLKMQFDAQSRYYQAEYPGAEFEVILLDGQPAGRLYLHRRENEIRIMDIALHPAFRGRGIATELLKNIQGEGARSNCRVTIHVEMFNRAYRLYERLGFRQISTTGVYHLLEWTPHEPPRASQDNVHER